MTSTGIAGLGVVILAAILLALFALTHRRFPFSFRNIAAIARIRRAASLVVEDGSQLHVSLGSGNVLTPAGASALAGLVLLRRLGEIASLSDRPPVATTGSGVLNLLAQDSLRAAHDSVAVEQAFNMNTSRLTGFTPLSYAAGALSFIHDDGISSNIFIGNFGPEVGLLTEAADRQNATVVSASDSLTAQAVMFASSTETLIGEELFSAGAYLQTGTAHTASLVVQDIMRWLIILAMLAGAGLKLAGLL